MYSAEEKNIRTLIRKVIRFKQLKENKEEQELRYVVRRLLKEGDIDSDTKPAPYESTSINMLADAFNQILPVLKTGLRKLAKPEERVSFRDHVVEKFRSIFDGFESLDAPAQALGDGSLTEQDEEKEEGIKITVDDPFRIMPSDGKEDDRFKEEEPDPEQDLEDEFKDFAKPGKNPTGARVAFETINDSNIQSVLADKRKTLFDDKDKQEFKEYALYNVDLWLLTYEKELSNTKGQEPAFSEPITEKPAGSNVGGAAAEFEGGGGMEMAMPEEGGEMELPELGEL
jgi:hypothetical protein